MGYKRIRPKSQRLIIAKDWVSTYNGNNIVKGYKKKFAVDILTALGDLQELGIEFDPAYIAAVEKSEKRRCEQLHEKRQEKFLEQQGIEKAGKNHIKVNGTLLQTNKKWSHLKQKQREWIYEITRTEHKKFIEKNNRLPMKTGKKKLIAFVESKIGERGIWLPSYEIENGIGKYIDRLNRKAWQDSD